MIVWILVVVIALQGAGVSSERFRFTTEDGCAANRVVVKKWLQDQTGTPFAVYCQEEQER